MVKLTYSKTLLALLSVQWFLKFPFISNISFILFFAEGGRSELRTPTAPLCTPPFGHARNFASPTASLCSFVGTSYAPFASSLCEKARSLRCASSSPKSLQLFGGPFFGYALQDRSAKADTRNTIQLEVIRLVQTII